ncbi:O-antigen ligase domain-containing protein [Trichothermofontia sp.]
MSKKFLPLILLYGFILGCAFVAKGLLRPFVRLILYSWIFVVVYIFKRFSPQRALIISFLVAVLFLPETGIVIRNDFVINKTTATSIGAILATLIYYPNYLLSFRPGLLDIPVIIWILSIIPSQVTNGLSVTTPMIQNILVWLVPYLLGRIYLRNLSDLNQLAIGIFIGGLIYAPLSLFENFKTPNLHLWVYGSPARIGSYLQTFRLGGYRPTIFMEHGLAVGMWMMAATLIGVWLWQMKVLPKKIWNYPTSWIIGGLVFVFIQVRSTGAYYYILLGLLVLLAAKFARTAIPLALIALISVSYVSLGATGQLYQIPQVREFMYSGTTDAAEEREGSLRFRLQNEELLSDHARQRFVLGWGQGAGRNRVFNEEGEDISVTDSIWIIEFGVRGIIGLYGFCLTFLLPALSFAFFRYPAYTWRFPKVAAAASLAIILVLYVWDSALNAFPNAIYTLASGGLATVVMKPREKLNSQPLRSSVRSQPLLPARSYRA